MGPAVSVCRKKEPRPRGRTSLEEKQSCSSTTCTSFGVMPAALYTLRAATLVIAGWAGYPLGASASAKKLPSRRTAPDRQTHLRRRPRSWSRSVPLRRRWPWPGQRSQPPGPPDRACCKIGNSQQPCRQARFGRNRYRAECAQAYRTKASLQTIAAAAPSDVGQHWSRVRYWFNKQAHKRTWDSEKGGLGGGREAGGWGG